MQRFSGEKKASITTLVSRHRAFAEEQWLDSTFPVIGLMGGCCRL
jgi:hypothetical protein